MKKLGYTQSNYLVDVRLGLGFSAVAIAGIVAAAEYHFGFNTAFPIIAVGVALYVVLNMAYMLWVWKVEGDIVYSGTTEKGDREVCLRTKVPNKYEPKYKLTVQFKDKATQKTTKPVDKEGVFMGWFGINGLIVFDNFEGWVKEAVEMAAKTEAKKVK